MSLLDDTRHGIELYPDVVKPDVLGNPGKREPDFDTPVPLWGRIQGNSSTELSNNGQQLLTYKTFRTRTFPAGAFSQLRINGDVRLWDIIGEPIYHDGSETTKHYTVSMVTSEPNPAYVPPAEPVGP